MAQIVGYFEDNGPDMYSEGPYVLVAGPAGQGFRIETRGDQYPILPPLWVYDLRRLRGVSDGWQPLEILQPIVDDLNTVHAYCEANR